eukprot:TRINITY_DN2075_c4_g1_i3.p1 TRINITY_DN2075_c4_g1~~TRINITY_DN2075_c4_g1_i3.p1  ORF type:complete len:287 (+),score=36.97 TRINITY_DN2075_c4_g1_i3:160-1020(+)
MSRGSREPVSQNRSGHSPQQRGQGARGAESEKYKTQICSYFRQGTCEFGPACTFAHGEHELRTATVPYPIGGGLTTTWRVGPSKERRYDAEDGQLYCKDEFNERYRAEAAQRWEWSLTEEEKRRQDSAEERSLGLPSPTAEDLLDIASDSAPPNLVDQADVDGAADMMARWQTQSPPAEDSEEARRAASAVHADIMQVGASDNLPSKDAMPREVCMMSLREFCRKNDIVDGDEDYGFVSRFEGKGAVRVADLLKFVQFDSTIFEQVGVLQLQKMLIVEALKQAARQ